MHKKTEAILAQIRELILTGEYANAGFLPPQQAMCRRFGLSRGSLRTILGLLEKEHLLQCLPGKGLKVLSAFERLAMHKIMLVMPSHGYPFSNEIPNLLYGAVTAAEDDNAEIVLFFLGKDTDSSRLAARLQESPWSGIIFLEKFPKDIERIVKQLNCRYCLTNSEREDDIQPAIRVDFRAVGRLAGYTLMNRGTRKIGFIGGDQSLFHYKEMLAGLKGALAEEDRTPEKKLLMFFKNEDDFSQIVSKIQKTLKEFTGQPIAIFAGRDRWAKPLYLAASNLHLRIPEDLAIIGFDNLSWPEGQQKGLTTISQPAFESGAQAVHAICGQQEIPSLTLIPPGEIIERTSLNHK